MGADPAGSRFRVDVARLRGCCGVVCPTVGSEVLRLLAPAIDVSCGLLKSSSTDAVEVAVERDTGLDRGCGVICCSTGVALAVG